VVFKTKLFTMLIYKCDGVNCKSESDNINTWLTIGSSDSSLRANNGLANQRLVNMNNHRDIHFCSKKCFVGYFFLASPEPIST